MQIKQTKNWFRRDFTAVVECEGCGNIQEISGYDDQNFYDNVVPEIRCGKCGKNTLELGKPKKHINPRYAKDTII